MPQPGDYIVFKFNQPTLISGFKFVSGNAEHPSDRFEETTIEIMPEEAGEGVKLNSEGFMQVGFFDENGIAEGDIDWKVMGKLKEMRILVGKSHENWAILSEIFVRTPEVDKKD